MRRITLRSYPGSYSVEVRNFSLSLHNFQVIPNRRNFCDLTCSPPTQADAAPSAQAADFRAPNEDQSEDLLYSLKTHFTPIRADIEDMEDVDGDGTVKERPLSSSLEELSSYRLPPEPPKRNLQKTKQAIVQEVSVPNPPAKAPVTHSE